MSSVNVSEAVTSRTPGASSVVASTPGVPVLSPWIVTSSSAIAAASTPLASSKSRRISNTLRSSLISLALNANVNSFSTPASPGVASVVNGPSDVSALTSTDVLSELSSLETVAV